MRTRKTYKRTHLHFFNIINIFQTCDLQLKKNFYKHSLQNLCKN